MTDFQACDRKSIIPFISKFKKVLIFIKAFITLATVGHTTRKEIDKIYQRGVSDTPAIFLLYSNWGF